MNLAQLLMQMKKLKMAQGEQSLQNILNTGGEVNQKQAEAMNEAAGMPKGYLQSISKPEIRPENTEREPISAEEYDKRFGEQGTQVNYKLPSAIQRRNAAEIEKEKTLIPIRGESAYQTQKRMLEAKVEMQPQLNEMEVQKQAALAPIRAAEAGMSKHEQMKAGLDPDIVNAEADKMETLADRHEEIIAKQWPAQRQRKSEQEQDAANIALEKGMALEEVKGARQMKTEAYKTERQKELEGVKHGHRLSEKEFASKKDFERQSALEGVKYQRQNQLLEDRLRGEAGIEGTKQENRLSLEEKRLRNRKTIEGMKLNATDSLRKAQAENLRANAEYHRQYAEWIRKGGKNKQYAPKIQDFMKSAEAGGFVDTKAKGMKILKAIPKNDKEAQQQFQQMADQAGIQIEWKEEKGLPLIGTDKVRPLPIVPKPGSTGAAPKTAAPAASQKEAGLRQDLASHGMTPAQVEDYIKRAKAAGKLQ